MQVREVQLEASVALHNSIFSTDFLPIQSLHFTQKKSRDWKCRLTLNVHNLEKLNTSVTNTPSGSFDTKLAALTFKILDVSVNDTNHMPAYMYEQHVHLPHHIISHHITYLELGEFIALVFFKTALCSNLISFIWGCGRVWLGDGGTEDGGEGVLYLGTDKKTN